MTIELLHDFVFEGSTAPGPVLSMCHRRVAMQSPEIHKKVGDFETMLVKVSKLWEKHYKGNGARALATIERKDDKELVLIAVTTWNAARFGRISTCSAAIVLDPNRMTLDGDTFSVFDKIKSDLLQWAKDLIRFKNGK